MEADIHHVEAEGGALAKVVVYSENRNTLYISKMSYTIQNTVVIQSLFETKFLCVFFFLEK